MSNMRNLSAEMARYGVTNSAIQKLLDCSPKTVTNKLSGTTEFTIGEALKIRAAFFPGLRMAYLFRDDVPPLAPAAQKVAQDVLSPAT